MKIVNKHLETLFLNDLYHFNGLQEKRIKLEYIKLYISNWSISYCSSKINCSFIIQNFIQLSLKRIFLVCWKKNRFFFRFFLISCICVNNVYSRSKNQPVLIGTE